MYRERVPSLKNKQRTTTHEYITVVLMSHRSHHTLSTYTFFLSSTVYTLKTQMEMLKESLRMR